MTRSKEYQNADAFKRLLIREIKAGNQLLKRGWTGELPASVHTLESVKEWYDRYLEKEMKRGD